MRGLPRAAKSALEKARDSALSAVEIYNKPAIRFRSGSYIVLMIIAWTSLLHAVFFKRKVKPFVKKSNGRFERIDGDYKYWQLTECLQQYYQGDSGNPVRKNLEFFIPLRDRIEHRSMPELDADIFGECQAMLLNFDELIEKEFGLKYCIRESLSFSLQLFPVQYNLDHAFRKNASLKSAIEFIRNYRSTISPEISTSGKYAFKAFLIQVKNHQSADALPIQFFHYDQLSDEEKKRLSKFAVFMKTKHVLVSNMDRMKPGDVVRKVQEALGNPKKQQKRNREWIEVDQFNSDTHVRCWKKYKVRPTTNSRNPRDTNQRYCIYDDAHHDYVYTQEWMDFLVSEFRRDKNLFISLYE
ncbi:MAG: DUF3644 domain-containing protein [Candidatus Peribacteraceae bacterium]